MSKEHDGLTSAVADNASTPVVSTAEEKSRPRRQKQDLEQPTVGVLISRLSDQIKGLILGEIELAKVKVNAMIAGVATAAVMFVSAAILALYGLGFLFKSLALALTNWVSPSIAHLIVGGGLILITVVFLLIGLVLLKRMPKDRPDPKKGMQSTVEAVKAGLSKDA